MNTNTNRPRMYKVLTPIEKRGAGGGTFWMRVGTAFPAKNDANALNLFLDVLPKGDKAMLHIREMDEEDFRPRRNEGPAIEPATANDLPF